MHEMSIAINIVDIAIETADKAEAKKINRIVLEIGSLSGIIPQSLQFCYESACRNTIAEGSELKLIIVPAIAECENCGHRFETEVIIPNCPKCDSFVSNVIGGKDMIIKSINVD